MLKRLRLWWWRLLTGYDEFYALPAYCDELGRLGSSRDVNLLIEWLRHANRYVQRAACRALGQLGDARTVEPLIKCLGDKWVRPAACAALGQLGDARAVEPLIRCLRDEDSDVRRAACVALGLLGDVRAVEPLMRNLNGSSADEAAEASLDAIYRRASSDFERYLCKEHLTRFEPRTTQASNHSVHYFGCRVCGKAGKPWRCVNTLVCVLDSAAAERSQPQSDTASGQVRALWAPARGLFDFDVVEIHQATSFDVEQFCIKVQNDEDRYRRGRYATVRCLVAPTCSLSEVSWRILRSTFGSVELVSARTGAEPMEEESIDLGYAAARPTHVG